MHDNVTTALKARWQELKNIFWVLPALTALVGVILAIVLIKVDRAIGQIDIPFIFGESPSSAHYILTTIAGSLITVAGLTFSVTVVALQLVSSQFTPRALRGFLSDRVTQATAGSLVGIFGYCLLVLTAVRSAPESGANFVPAVSLTVAIALAFVGLALLLLFIHHTAQSIQVTNIAARVVRDAAAAVRQPYPGAVGKPLAVDAANLLHTWRAEGTPGRIEAPRAGYVQTVALADLLRAIARPGLRMHLRVAPGDFVTPTTVLADLWPADAADQATVRAFRRAIAVLRQRDVNQDVAFSTRILADIALRALSPGINDPTTAITCFGYLRALLEPLAAHDDPATVQVAGDGQVTAILHHRRFADHLDIVRELGHSAADNARVAGALLDLLAHLIEAAHNRERVAVIASAAETVAGPAIRAAATRPDRTYLRARLGRLRRLAQARARRGNGGRADEVRHEQIGGPETEGPPMLSRDEGDGVRRSTAHEGSL